jgi:general secretion pathway protein G
MQSNAKQIVRRLPAQAGFTLVELLLVVAILGILAGVVAVNVAGHGDKARVAATRQSIANIETAVKMYEVTNGGFPDSLDQLTVGTEETAAPLKKEGLNDSWGTPFQYKKTSKTSIEVRSAGPDKSMGSGDDLTN